MRKFFSKIHLWLSVPFGLIVTVICLSGASLVFEKEITEALNPHLYRVSHEAGSRQLPPSVIVERVMGQLPDSLRMASVQFSSDADASCLVAFSNAGRRTLSVNPYDGSINGWMESNGFFQIMRRIHRWLLDAPAAKGEMSVGKFVVGTTTIVFVIIMVSGLVIWIPRNRKSLSNRMSISLSKGWRRFWYDSHVALGFYATILLLVMALTGLTWSFGWYRNAAYSLFGAETDMGGKSAAHAVKATPSDRREGKKPFNYVTWDIAWEKLRSVYPEYSYIKLGNGTAEVSTNADGRMRRLDKVVFDRVDGHILQIDKYDDAPVSQKLRGIFYSLHTGNWGGVWSKILYLLAALTGGVLPLSGYYLWLKKRRRSK